MSEWCLQHPYMTFFVVLFAIATAGSTLITIFGKHEETPKKDNDENKQQQKSTGNPDLN